MSMIERDPPPLPGNKRRRTRAAALNWRLRGDSGWIEESPKGRSAFLRHLPVWEFIGPAQRDAAFVTGIERVSEGRTSAATFAARYQRLDSYGHRVLLALIEPASAAAARAEDKQAAIRISLASHMSYTFAVDADLEGDDRRRSRRAPWRGAAARTLLALGGRRCLICEAELRKGHRHYCSAHSSFEPIRGDQLPESARRRTKRHDLEVSRARDLIREVGEILDVD